MTWPVAKTLWACQLSGICVNWFSCNSTLTQVPQPIVLVSTISTWWQKRPTYHGSDQPVIIGQLVKVLQDQQLSRAAQCQVLAITRRCTIVMPYRLQIYRNSAESNKVHSCLETTHPVSRNMLIKATPNVDPKVILGKLESKTCKAGHDLLKSGIYLTAKAPGPSLMC